MTILFLSIEFNYCCGISRSIFSLSRELKGNGHRIILGCPGGTMIDDFKHEGMEFVAMPFYPDSKKVIDILSASRLIYSTVKNCRVDIIHTHHRLPEFLAVPVGRLLRKPTVTTCHAIIYGKTSLSFLSDKIIAVSNAVKENLVAHFKVNPERVEVIANIPRNFPPASEKDILSFKKAHRISEGNFIVAGIGRLHFEKGFDILLNAVNGAHGLNLTTVLVGKGSEKQTLKQLVKDQENNVIFIDETSNLETIYTLADAIVVPSRMESAGLVPVEASFFDKAVIAANVGGLRQSITDGSTGLLVAPEDPDEILHAIKKLYFDPELRTRLGTQLNKKIKEKYNAKEIRGQVMDVYKNLMSKYAD